MTKRPRGTPANLTGVIENSRDAWDKLWWNLQQFEYALSERSHLGAAQAYALIDYAVAESALHAWVLADYLDGLEPGSTTTLLPTSPREAGRNLISRVKWSGALRAIANSAKHAREDDDWWPGGANLPVLNADPELSSEYENFLSHEAWARLIDSLVSGASWYESQLFSENGEATPAHRILPENYDSWTETIGWLGLQ